MKHDANKNAYLSKLSLFLSNATSTVNPSETKSCRDFDQNEGREKGHYTVSISSIFKVIW